MACLCILALPGHAIAAGVGHLPAGYVEIERFVDGDALLISYRRGDQAWVELANVLSPAIVAKVGAIKQVTKIEGLIVSGTGGDFGAGLVIGRMARQNNWRTLVPPDLQCVSSCALVFVGGTRRAMAGKNSLLVFHAPQLRDREGRVFGLSRSNPANDQYCDYLKDMLPGKTAQMICDQVIEAGRPYLADALEAAQDGVTTSEKKN